MSYPPISKAESLRIGTVEFVSPDEIKVQLELEAPTGVALNTGAPRAFPRVNSYLLIPNDEGHLVAQVEWITIERSQFPKRNGMQDFGLVDLPYPQRRMKLNPLGILRFQPSDTDSESEYDFRRGMESFPSVGDPVLLPTDAQLRGIIESGENRHVVIGTSPLAANAEVRVNPDRLFGRHLAVLGNTGSGKSCTVAGLIRWSLEAAQKARDENAEYGIDAKSPNARFIILDPNGEYTNTFNDLGGVRAFAVEASEAVKQLRVPAWMWNSDEWSAFTLASEKVQRPIIRRTLRDIKAGRSQKTTSMGDQELALRRYLSTRLTILRKWRNLGKFQFERGQFANALEAIRNDLLEKANSFSELMELGETITAIDAGLDAHRVAGKDFDYYTAFDESEVQEIIDKFKSTLTALGGALPSPGPHEDTPIEFKETDFPDHLEVLAQEDNVSQFTDFLLARIRTLLANTKIKNTISTEASISLATWLETYIGKDQAENGAISILDLSLLPTEIIHTVTSVIARMTLEALQRYRKLNNGSVLPTVLVMEEAHNFVQRYTHDADNRTSASVCTQIFERIAREGRKFGLGLVLSSQRPSELSPTVLSQCNTYLLHRISNDRDQELVHRLVPDNLRGILRDLPNLPSQNAIVLGWATELPVLTQITTLPTDQRPKSEDPDFWAVWTGRDDQDEELERNVDWQFIADEWQSVAKTENDNHSDIPYLTEEDKVE